MNINEFRKVLHDVAKGKIVEGMTCASLANSVRGNQVLKGADEQYQNHVVGFGNSPYRRWGWSWDSYSDRKTRHMVGAINKFSNKWKAVQPGGKSTPWVVLKK